MLRFEQLSAVCLDMDGTLVDTEGVYAEARALACEQLLGFRPTDEEAISAVGLADSITIGRMLARRHCRVRG